MRGHGVGRLGMLATVLLLLGALRVNAQSLTVSADTTASDVQTYSNLTIKGNARLTLSGATWAVTNNLFVSDGTANNLGHLVLTNGTVLTHSGGAFQVQSSATTATSTVTVANGTLAVGNGMLLGWTSGAGALYIGQGGVLTNGGFTVECGSALIENGATVILPNKAIALGPDVAGVVPLLTIRGATTRFIQGTASGATLSIGRKGSPRVLITDGVAVTNWRTTVGDAMFGAMPAGAVTGRLTVAGGARLYSADTIIAGSTPTGGKAGGLGVITVTDSNSAIEAVTITIDGTNATYPSSLLITSQGMARASSQFAVGHGSITLTEGGTMDLTGTQINILTGTSGTISNRGGVISFAVIASSLSFNTYGQLGRIVTDGGTIAIRGRSNEYGVYDNQDSKLTNITFLGANSFMLDASSTKTATSQNYLFDTGQNASNYVGLILRNKSTYQGGMANIGTNGWMELSGSGITNTLSEICTNWGRVTVLSGTAKFSKTLRNYGLLESSGRLEGGVTNFGGSTVAPGGTNGYGTVVFANSNALLPGATAAYQFGGAGAGQYDSATVESGATLNITGATLTCELKYLVDGVQSWTLINNNGTVTGTFTGTNPWTQSYGGRQYRFRVAYDGGDGNDVVLTVTRLVQGTSLLLY